MRKKPMPLNREPIYRDLQKEIRIRIRQGHWRKGALIPSRRALADEFKVSVPTVRKAIADMVAEGVLRVNAKRGTYVFGDPDPMVDGPSGSGGDGASLPDDAAKLGSITGHVSLISDIRPGPSSLFTSGWPFVVIHEAEYALAQYGIQSRFSNRFDAYRQFKAEEQPAHTVDELKPSIMQMEAALAENPAAVILHEAIISEPIRGLIRQAALAGISTVVVGCEEVGEDYISVMYDSANAAYQAAGHLINRGYQRLMFFSPYQANWAEQRAAGARSALAASGLSCKNLIEHIAPSHIHDVINGSDSQNPHEEAAYQYATQILAKGLNSDGVIAVNDSSAMGFVRAAGEFGLVIGKDYGIVGFDDSPEAQALGLTTMHPPCVSMGREAARAAARAVRGQDDLSAVILKSRLVLRTSSPARTQ